MTLKGGEKKATSWGPQEPGNDMVVSSLGFYLFHIFQTWSSRKQQLGRAQVLKKKKKEKKQTDKKKTTNKSLISLAKAIGMGQRSKTENIRAVTTPLQSAPPTPCSATPPPHPGQSGARGSTAQVFPNSLG